MKQGRSGAILEAEGGLYHMGIFMQHLGEVKLPEKHRAKYAQQALKLLRAGGMMTVEPVQLSGHKLYLLSPPELDEDGKAIGHYNYLDANSGERWCLNAKDGCSMDGMPPKESILIGERHPKEVESQVEQLNTQCDPTGLPYHFTLRTWREGGITA